MSVSISFSITGDKQLARKLSSIGSKLDDFSSPLQKAKNLMLEGIEKQHSSSGSEFGNSFSALSPRYSAIKAKRWGNQPILTASGKMRKGYSSSVGRTQAVIWNKVSYFQFHHTGTDKMPKRKVFVISPKYQKDIVKIFEDYISKSIK